MSTKRNSKRKNKGNESRLLLKKQQISGASLQGVHGGGESSALISGAASGIYSASSSILETPVASVSGPVSVAMSAYASNHIQDTIKQDSTKVKNAVVKGAKAVGSGISKAFHWLDPLSI